jgi:hypothetical protein
MDSETFYHSSFFPTNYSSRSTTDEYLVKELLDFSLNKISGIYTCSTDEMLFEMTEGNIIALAELEFKGPQLVYKVFFNHFTEYSLSYYCSVHIYHQDRQASIKIPCFRSYNPVGVTEYLTYSQFMFILKITAAATKAAISGALEKDLVYLKNSISPLQSYISNKIIIDYMFVQIKTACYKKISPPSFPEYIFAQVIKNSCILKDDTKDYLESYLMYLKGEISEIKIPVEYYKSITKTDRKLPWDLKVKYLEIETKRIKKVRLLKLLPNVIESMSYIETGTNYNDMNKEIKKISTEFMQSVEDFSKCIIT